MAGLREQLASERGEVSWAAESELELLEELEGIFSTIERAGPTHTPNLNPTHPVVPELQLKASRVPQDFYEFCYVIYTFSERKSHNFTM